MGDVFRANFAPFQPAVSTFRACRAKSSSSIGGNDWLRLLKPATAKLRSPLRGLRSLVHGRRHRFRPRGEVRPRRCGGHGACSTHWSYLGRPVLLSALGGTQAVDSLRAGPGLRGGAHLPQQLSLVALASGKRAERIKQIIATGSCFQTLWPLARCAQPVPPGYCAGDVAGERGPDLPKH